MEWNERNRENRGPRETGEDDVKEKWKKEEYVKKIKSKGGYENLMARYEFSKPMAAIFKHCVVAQ